MKRCCIICGDEIFESFGSVVCSSLLRGGPLLEVCGRCVFACNLYVDFGVRQQQGRYEEVMGRLRELSEVDAITCI